MTALKGITCHITFDTEGWSMNAAPHAPNQRLYVKCSSMSGLIPSMWWPDRESYDTAVRLCPDVNIDIETCEFLESVQGQTLEDDFAPFNFTSWLDMWRHWIRGRQRLVDIEAAETLVREAVR